MAKELTRREIWTLFEEAVNKTNQSLSANQEKWIDLFNGYRLNPSFVKNDKEKSKWINAYYSKPDGIENIEKKTPLSFYISTQGSASLRFDGRKVISNIKVGKIGKYIGKWAPLAIEKAQEVGIILPDIYEENGNLNNCINSRIVDIINKCFTEDMKGKGEKLENYYESRILKELQGKFGFYRWMYPVKRIIVREEKKKEVGLYQVATAIKASDLSFKYSGSKGGGIDVLARRGRGNRDQILTLFELKKKYKKPEVVMQQLISYGVFLCNLIDSDPAGWGKEFGYTGKGGYSKRELNLAVMMPAPNTGNPRTDFLEHPSIEITTYNNTRYCLNLHYAFFSPEDVRDVKFTSLPSLD